MHAISLLDSYDTSKKFQFSHCLDLVESSLVIVCDNKSGQMSQVIMHLLGEIES